MPPHAPPPRDTDWLHQDRLCGGIERVSAFFRDRHFSPHRHDTYALGFTWSGVQTFDYRGETHHARPGDVYILHPDERHDGRPGTADGFGFTGLYLAPERVADAGRSAGLPFVADTVLRDAALKRIISAAYRFAPHVPDELAWTDLLTALTDALWRLAGGPPPHAPDIRPNRIGRIREHLLAAAVDGVGMDELEREHGLDRFAISRAFRRFYGISPHRYLTHRRLELAMRLARGGTPLAEAATAAGFADQSHMTRHFRDAFGVTPAVWLKLREHAHMFDPAPLPRL
jgi:AraC-like DNA-binding protein